MKITRRARAVLGATTAIGLSAALAAAVIVQRQTPPQEALAAPVAVSTSASTPATPTATTTPTQAPPSATPPSITSQPISTTATATPVQKTTDAAPESPGPTTPASPAPQPRYTAPRTTRPACPTGTLELTDLAVYTSTEKLNAFATVDRLTATGKLVNRSNAGIHTGSYATPMVYGLNDAGKSVALLHTGSLTPDWDTGPVSPQDFVIKPGASATFKITAVLPYRMDEVKKWYATRPLTYWDDSVNHAYCSSPDRAGDVSPADG